MIRELGRMRAAMAALLVAAAILFVGGILIERGTSSASSPHVEATSPPAVQSATPQVEGSGETSGEAGESHAPVASAATSGEASGEATEAGGHPANGGSESILGIDPEAPPLVALAIILSLLAAFLVWRDGRRMVIGGAIAVALGFAALDLLEISHQAREGTTLVAIIAGSVAVGHLLASAIGVTVLRRSRAS